MPSQDSQDLGAVFWELFFVEYQIRAAPNFSLHVGGHRRDNVEAAASRQHPGFQRLVGVEIRDVDLYTG
jgi:hypothetical protein